MRRSQPQLLEPVVHFLEMEVERTERFEFALLEMFGHFGIGLELLHKIRVITAGVFHFPTFSSRRPDKSCRRLHASGLF